MAAKGRIAVVRRVGPQVPNSSCAACLWGGVFVPALWWRRINGSAVGPTRRDAVLQLPDVAQLLHQDQSKCDEQQCHKHADQSRAT